MHILVLFLHRRLRQQTCAAGNIQWKRGFAVNLCLPYSEPATSTESVQRTRVTEVIWMLLFFLMAIRNCWYCPSASAWMDSWIHSMGEHLVWGLTGQEWLRWLWFSTESQCLGLKIWILWSCENLPWDSIRVPILPRFYFWWMTPPRSAISVRTDGSVYPGDGLMLSCECRMLSPSNQATTIHTVEVKANWFGHIVVAHAESCRQLASGNPPNFAELDEDTNWKNNK